VTGRTAVSPIARSTPGSPTSLVGGSLDLRWQAPQGKSLGLILLSQHTSQGVPAMSQSLTIILALPSIH